MTDIINWLFSVLEALMTSFKIGELAGKYETSGKGPGFISEGSKWGDPGGDSYGSYQIETNKGTMKDYLTRTKDAFTASLRGLKINSAEFKAQWRLLAKQDPDGFQQSQFDFLCSKPNGHNDAYAFAKKLGWAIDNFALESAVFSTSNQSGRWSIIFAKANILPTDSVIVQINKLYDARAEYFKKLNLTPAIKKAIIKARTIEERRDCLSLLNKQ